MKKNCVVVTRAPEMNYRRDYVALPKDYGTPAYYAREDVAAIMSAVEENLNRLDERTGFTRKISGGKILIKPNFVTVYHNAGFRDADYPQTTDPRVLDAVVMYLRRYTGDIIIVEGSGMPVTRMMVKINGTDRLVKHRQIRFSPVEEQPLDRYFLPKARVMKEVYIPRILSEVVSGEAFYVSLPKMKTNLYTGVTLGFKNAMGCLPTNMRYRNHNYNIHKKLVDLLYLLRPDLTVIDGIVGAEGNVPAPADPVDAGLIISGTNSVETDRTATRIMGFDPQEIGLMREADSIGFGDPDVEILGEPAPVTWRRADTSVVTGRIAESFPGVRFLVGSSKNSASKPESLDEINIDLIKGMEQSCPGGCLPTVIMAFTNYLYHRKGCPESIRLTVVIGEGADLGSTRYYFDRNCRPYTREEILTLEGPVVAAGSCASWLEEHTRYFAGGCTPCVSKLVTTVDRAAGRKNPLVGMIAKHPSYLLEILKTVRTRTRIAKSGSMIDVAICTEDRIFDPGAPADAEKDYIPLPLPAPTREGIKRQIYYARHPIPL